MVYIRSLFVCIFPSFYAIKYKQNFEDEGQNFEQLNFRMANISKLKINERANVERPNLRESLE